MTTSPTKATSMFIESGHKYVRNELIAKLLNEFECYYKKFLDGGLSAILDEYKSVASRSAEK